MLRKGNAIKTMLKKGQDDTEKLMTSVKVFGYFCKIRLLFLFVLFLKELFLLD